jgi:hypothetical protein
MASSTTQPRPETEKVTPDAPETKADNRYRYDQMLDEVANGLGHEFMIELDALVGERMANAQDAGHKVSLAEVVGRIQPPSKSAELNKLEDLIEDLRMRLERIEVQGRAEVREPENEETDVTVWDVEELRKKASRLRDPNQFMLACLIAAVEEQWERRLADLRSELAKEVRTQRLVVATEDGYAGVAIDVDCGGADLTLYCPRGADDQADYTGIKLGTDRKDGILGSFDLIQDEDDAKVFDTFVEVSRGSGPVAGEGMRLNSDGVTVPPWRRHAEAAAKQTGARLATVEAQAERIAGKLDRLLLRLTSMQAGGEK